MTTVFIGGSRKVSRLNQAVKDRLDNIIDQGFSVVVGDANGADSAVQKYFVEKDYRNVTVFCMEGVSRNNLGQWPTRAVSPPHRTKDFRYYATKDFEMAKEATHGFMLWDGGSKGTLNNILNLLKGGKQVLVYNSRENSIRTYAQPWEAEELLKRCDQRVLDALKAPTGVRKQVGVTQTSLSITQP